MNFSDLDAAIDAALPRALADLERLVQIPTVAANPDAPMAEGAALVAELYRERGFLTTLSGAGGPPVVFAEERSAGVDAPTALLYNHYDVQPAEPLDLWESDPWTIRRDGDFLFARGVSDDKGHIVCRLLALDALKSVLGALPVNVKALVEGEEEVASVHLEAWMESHAALLSADVTLWEFGGVDGRGRPEILCGLRGIATFELRVKTISHDAHSGMAGSILPNAAWRLVWALASLKDAQERIQLPGHDDSVISPTDADRALFAAMSAETENDWKARFGVKGFLGGATGPALYEQQSFLPTCTINGIASGYDGPGAKTVLPAEGRAKLDFRLVPNQTPEAVHHALRAHLDSGGFTDIEILYLGGQKPGRVDPDHPLVLLAAKTAEEVYGIAPTIHPLSPVTGPIHPFVEGLKQPIATIGCGYPGARVHSPNENLRISDLVRGARHTARYLWALSHRCS